MVMIKSSEYSMELVDGQLRIAIDGELERLRFMVLHIDEAIKKIDLDYANELTSKVRSED